MDPPKLVPLLSTVIANDTVLYSGKPLVFDDDNWAKRSGLPCVGFGGRVEVEDEGH